MNTIKTTVVFPRDIWLQFQKITGKKKTSQILSKMTQKLVKYYNAKKLLNKSSDKTWDDAYLDKCLTNEIKALEKDKKLFL